MLLPGLEEPSLALIAQGSVSQALLAKPFLRGAHVQGRADTGVWGCFSMWEVKTKRNPGPLFALL